MDRRDFIKTAGLAGGLGMAPLGSLVAGEDSPVRSRMAFRRLVQTLAEVEENYLSPERGFSQPSTIADGERFLMHLLETALFHWTEADPERPVFKPYVTPTRKLLGDNPDSLYYFAPILEGRSYRVTGNIAGAVFTSFTIESGVSGGRSASGSAAAVDDGEMEIAADGSFELLVGPDKQDGNWLPTGSGAGQITTRHYYETELSVANNPEVDVRLRIEALDPPAELPRRTDVEIAERIEWVINYIRAMSLEMPTPGGPEVTPGWASTTPNRFNPPGKWEGETGYGNAHAQYAMAPYLCLPDQALVIEGRFPECRFANVVLWNRFLQTYDYVHRQISLNRVQTALEADGSYRIILAHSDPGLPNWLDTQGRVSGIVYWRFLKVRDTVPTPRVTVLSLAELAGQETSRAAV